MLSSGEEVLITDKFRMPLIAYYHYIHTVIKVNLCLNGILYNVHNAILNCLLKCPILLYIVHGGLVTKTFDFVQLG